MMRLLALSFTAAALATPVPAQDTAQGAALYETHCAMCHGADGTGHGPISGSLIVQPADLTRLAADNGGIFPVLQVVRRIDGRDPLLSHGSPMPVYGPYFEGVTQVGVASPSGQPILVSIPIADLLAYLQQIQAK